ncbi:MAG: hypothetical protein HZB53_00795 [Chloroflexi bacterium]|nr:hypothetical protein [Chloroflexota bacterium]
MLEHHFLDMAALDQKHRYAELREQAARERLLAGPVRTPAWPRRALARLGVLLVACGHALLRMSGTRAAAAGING